MLLLWQEMKVKGMSHLVWDLVQCVAQLDQHAHEADHLVAHRREICLHTRHCDSPRNATQGLLIQAVKGRVQHHLSCCPHPLPLCCQLHADSTCCVVLKAEHVLLQWDGNLSLRDRVWVFKVLLGSQTLLMISIAVQKAAQE